MGQLLATTTADQAEIGAARVRGLGRQFKNHTVLDQLDLDLAFGDFVAMLGHSGCGKSTLLRILAGLDSSFTGSVQVSRRRAVAFQSPRLMPWKRVWSNVVLGLPGRPDRRLAVDYLTEVGTAARADAWPKTLSGGEAQRVSLARALVREPDLLLLDEPFAALDALTRLKAQQLVAQLWQRHRCAILLVTHDVEEALLLADRVMVMNDGRIAHEVVVDLPRPRDITNPAFIALRGRLLGWLGVVIGSPDATSGHSAAGFPEPAHPYDSSVPSDSPTYVNTTESADSE